MNKPATLSPVPPPQPIDEDRPVMLRLRTLGCIIAGALSLGFGYSSITGKQNEQALKLDALRDEVRALAAKVETLRDTRLSAR